MKFTVLRSTVAAIAGLTMLTATTLPAQSREDVDPTDLVPRRYSVENFRSLSVSELYMVKLAIKRGRRLLINGYSPSKSRRMIEDATGSRY